MISFGHVFFILLALILLLIPGIALKKLKLLNKAGLAGFVVVLMYVGQPFLTIQGFVLASDAVPRNGQMAINLLIMFGLSVLAHLLLFGVAKAIFLPKFSGFLNRNKQKLAKAASGEVNDDTETTPADDSEIDPVARRVLEEEASGGDPLILKNKKTAGVYQFITVFSNTGFLGIPFIHMLVRAAFPGPYGTPYLYADIARIYAVVFVVVFNMASWTLGVVMVTGSWKAVRIKRAFLNPAVFVAVFAVPMFFFPQINIFNHPSNAFGAYSVHLGQIVRFFALMATGVSMIVVGVRMADVPLKQMITSAGAYVSSFAKLIIAPLVMFLACFVLYHIGLLDVRDPNNLMILVMIAMAAMPAAASMLAFTERFKGDSDLAIEGFLVSTVLSLITMPILLPLLLNVFF